MSGKWVDSTNSKINFLYSLGCLVAVGIFSFLSSINHMLRILIIALIVSGVFIFTLDETPYYLYKAQSF